MQRPRMIAIVYALILSVTSVDAQGLSEHYAQYPQYPQQGYPQNYPQPGYPQAQYPQQTYPQQSTTTQIPPGMTLTCMFTSGPQQGHTVSFMGVPGAQPTYPGRPCTDGQGSYGTAAPQQ